MLQNSIITFILHLTDFLSKRANNMKLHTRKVGNKLHY